MFLLILFFLSTKVILAQTCSISGSFNTAPETSCSYSFNCEDVVGWCTWTIVGDGYFVDGSGTKLTDSKQLYIPRTQNVSIKWENTQSYNSISVTGYDNSGIQHSDTQKVNVQYIAKPRFIASSPLDVYYNNTAKIIISVYVVPNATKYVWTVPSGWSGPTTTQSISDTVTTNVSLQPGVVTCRAGVGTFLGDTATLNITRSVPPIQLLSNPSFGCTTTAPLTYSVTPLTNATYLWTLPSGWSGSTTTQTNSNTVTPNGLNGGTLTVAAQVTDGNITKQSPLLSTELSLSSPALSFLNAPNILCNSSSKTFSVSGASANASYTWVTTNNVLINGQPSPYTTTNNSVSLSAPSSYGNMTLSVYSNNTCNQTSPTISKTIWIGTPDDSQIQMGVATSLPPNDKVVRNQDVIIMATHPNTTPEGITNFNWYFSGWTQYLNGYSNTGTIQHDRPILHLNNNASSQQAVLVAAENECGCAEEGMGKAKMFYAVSGGMYMSISPNPANSNMEININPVATQTISEQSVIPSQYDVKIYNFFGVPVYNTKKKENKFSLQTANLHEGVYFIVISNGRNSVRQQFIVKH